MLSNYYPIHYPYYQQAIEDDLYAAKWGMLIQLLDVSQKDLQAFPGKNFALIGFKCDKGVYINNGRVGAVEGPQAIRQQIAKLPWHLGREVQVFDVGNIDGPNKSLEELQASLAALVKRVRELNLIPIVLGGGHETAYGHFKGLKDSLNEDETLATINMDAHFDLRPYDQTGPNSGTGFRQMYDNLANRNEEFPYLILGLQEHNNNLFLFDFVAKSSSIQFLTGMDLYRMAPQEIFKAIDAFLEGKDHIYLTIDMDCFSYGMAPGVSAIQSLGVDPKLALLLFQHLASTGKLLGFDIVEVSPPHDIDNHTSNLAATFVFYLTQIMAQH